MQARAQNPIIGMANRNSLAESLFSVAAFHSGGHNVRELSSRINKAGRDAFALLERWELIEPADDMNGRNGYLVLTEKGRTTTERTDFERIRVRGFLREEMLHPLLQGKVYSYFAGDDLGTAVFEAFKTVEIEVRGAGHYAEKEVGKTLMFKAFAVGGPLAKSGDDKTDCEAVGGLFAGALSRFRNPGAHTNRTFQDVLEAMEELMLASRLLRIVDERRRPSMAPEILEAWDRLEGLMRQMSDAQHPRVSDRLWTPPRRIEEAARELGLDAGEISALMELRKLSDQVAHSADVPVTEAEAARFKAATERLLARMIEGAKPGAD
jgi:uncharacterized protein (TIGR02391 family)